MVLKSPDIESFIAEARDAGAVRVYTVFVTEFRRTNGVPVHQARYRVTAVGTVACHAGGAEKALLRYEKDFGPVIEDVAERRPPESYRRRVKEFGRETRAKLEAAGFEVRDGEIEAL